MLGPRDVLGIYIGGVLGQSDEPPPVHFPEDGNLPPAIGFSIPIRADGTLSLPLVPPLNVGGLSLAQAERMTRQAYTVDQKILQPGRDRIIVTLITSRTYRAVVVREDATSPVLKHNASSGHERVVVLTGRSGKRGATYTVELPAYENDVLHALSESGGLPGLDAKNEVTILRGGLNNREGTNVSLMSLTQEVAPAPAAPQLPTVGPGMSPFQTEMPQFGFGFEVPAPNRNVLKIPLRRPPYEPPLDLSEDDIILNAGDILFIESRDAEVFYTGGLIEGGQFPIPRDYDLDVLGAIAMAGGSIAAGAGSGTTQGGFGGNSGMGGLFPPTRVIVLRTVHGQQTAIRISLRRAMRSPRERILIEPNDFILLEYTPIELALNLVLSQIQFNYFMNNMGN